MNRVQHTENHRLHISVPVKTHYLRSNSASGAYFFLDAHMPSPYPYEPNDGRQLLGGYWSRRGASGDEFRSEHALFLCKWRDLDRRKSEHRVLRHAGLLAISV